MEPIGPALPMFPLGSVLLPGAVLPLRVFEPRYRALTEDCLAGAREFGVVLIERGHEVGGGDSRFDVGTVARIERVARLEDGGWVLIALGTERLRVVRWLDDDPYPRAIVERLDDSGATVDAEQVQATIDGLGRVLELRAALGGGATASGEPSPGFALDIAAWTEDPVRASFEIAARAGLGPLDGQRLLALDGLAERFATLLELLEQQAELLEFRLGG